MEDIIVSKLKEIEEKYNAKILFACESGSRAWGFNSPNSDYDVRFIYVRPLRANLTVFEPRDVIEFETNEVFDINGWDLRKSLKLLYKYNPTLMEWLRSPIVYYQRKGFMESFLKLSDEYYNKFSCKHHYFHMARGNFERYLQNDVVSLKKYLYVLRPLVAIDFINKYDCMPPTSFMNTLAMIDLDHDVREAINQLIDIKMSSEELGMGEQIECLSDYVRNSLKDFEATKEYGELKSTEPLDNFLSEEVLKFYE